jgi:hypothetical protein
MLFVEWPSPGKVTHYCGEANYLITLKDYVRYIYAVLHLKENKVDLKA